MYVHFLPEIGDKKTPCYIASKMLSSKAIFTKFSTAISLEKTVWSWCEVDYYIVRWHESTRMTPRGTQDKQPLALTWCELPWAPADYKTWYSNIEQAVQRRSSREPHLQSVTRNCYTNTNKRITRSSYRPLQLPTSFHLTARYRYALESSDDIMLNVL